MGLFGKLFGKAKPVKVHYRPSKHDKIKAWAKTKDAAYWANKKPK